MPVLVAPGVGLHLGCGNRDLARYLEHVSVFIFERQKIVIELGLNKLVSNANACGKNRCEFTIGRLQHQQLTSLTITIVDSNMQTVISMRISNGSACDKTQYDLFSDYAKFNFCFADLQWTCVILHSSTAISTSCSPTPVLLTTSNMTCSVGCKRLTLSGIFSLKKRAAFSSNIEILLHELIPNACACGKIQYEFILEF